MKPECEMLRRFLTDPTCKSEECVSIDVISETLSEKYGFEITPKMIKGCINHWNKLRNKLYIDMKEHGLLSGNPKEDWDFVTSDFVDKYGIIPLSFKKSRGIMGTYITASYEEQEEIETANVVHKIKGLETQLKHMHLIGAKFQITGKTPYELLGNAKEMKTKVLNGKVTEIVNEENVYKEEDFKNEIIEKLESETIDEENVPKEETSKEQSNEKTLKEISFLKEKITRLEAEGRNHNTKVLNRLEERLKMITHKTDEFEQIPKTELKVPGIFDKKTTEKIEKFDKKWGDLDTWIKGDQKTEEISKEESQKIPELKKDESPTFVNYELNSETKNIQTSEEPIEKWGEAAYEESKLAKAESTTTKLSEQTPKEEIVEKPEEISEKIKEEQSSVEISKEETVETSKDETPKKRILRRIIRRKPADEK